MTDVPGSRSSSSRVLLLALAVIVGCSLVAQGAHAGPPTGLSSNGRILWQFEALLHDTFGNSPVCSSGRWRQRFTSGECAPLAVYSPYVYTFTRANGSAFHITTKKASHFGNYPQPVLIRGRNIACNRSETTFLVKQVDAASFALRCLRAGVTNP